MRTIVSKPQARQQLLHAVVVAALRRAGACTPFVLALSLGSAPVLAAPAGTPSTESAGVDVGQVAVGVVPLTLPELVRRVRAASPELARIGAGLLAAEAEVTAAGLWENPSIAYDREEVFDAAGGYPENSVRLMFPLEISGRHALEARAAAQGLEAARAAAAHDQHRLLLAANETFLHAAAARHRLFVVEADQAALGSLVGALRARRTEGEASGYDLERLEIEIDVAADAAAELRRELHRLRRALGWLVGDSHGRYDADDELGLPDSVAARPRSSRGEAGSVEAPAAAGQARRDVAAAALRRAQAETEIDAASRGWVPGLTVTGGVKSASVSTGTAWGYTAGVALSLPFFDHGQGDEARARGRLARARADQDLLQSRAVAESAVALDALGRSVEQAQRFARVQLPRAERLVTRASLSFVEGEHEVFELLDAYRTARELRLRSIDLRLAARLHEIELWRAMGRHPEAK